jgi:hypothetical protein
MLVNLPHACPCGARNIENWKKYVSNGDINKRNIYVSHMIRVAECAERESTLLRLQMKISTELILPTTHDDHTIYLRPTWLYFRRRHICMRRHEVGVHGASAYIDS